MKDIKGYENKYAVTEDGRVWSYLSKKYLKPKITKRGYCQVTLCNSGEKKYCLVHRLVAEAYIPNPDNLPQVSHIDETTNNNAVENLIWCDAKENCNMPLHKQRKSRGLLNNATSRQVLCVETNITYPSMSEAARQMGCTPQNIRIACVKTQRTACGYHWRYINE